MESGGTGVAGLMVPDGQSCIPKKVPEVGLDSGDSEVVLIQVSKIG